MSSSRRDVDGQIADAISIGKRNKEIIDLAFAWCQNIRLDRRMMGVGLVEQQTGLPIGGGTFTCEFARGPSPCGMKLESIAIDFYQRNCVGCASRKPSAILKNLGTWADELLDEQRRQADAAKTDEEHREAERNQRHRNRRLAIGQPDALVQAILDLVDKIDSGRPGKDSATELIALAGLHPDAFGDELLQALLIDARTCRLKAILEAITIVNQQCNRPPINDVLGVAYSAVAGAWAGDAAIELVASYAEEKSIESVGGLFQAAVRLAGPHTIFHSGPMPNPSIILRFYNVAPEITRELLAGELKHGDDWRRGSAAKAAGFVIEHDPKSAQELLESLLDSLKFPEDSRRGPEKSPSEEAASVIARILVRDPLLVEQAVEKRWKNATGDYRRAIFSSYDKVSRSRLDEKLATDVATTVARRALNCLVSTGDDELASDAGDLLEMVFEYHGASVNMPPDTLFGALAILSANRDELEKKPRSGNPLDPFELMSERSRADNGIRHVMDALVAVAAQSPDHFWPAMSEVWDNAADESTLRRALMFVVGRCAKRYQALPLALPYLYTGLMCVDYSARSRAVAAISEIRWNDVSAIPDSVTIGVMLALDDRYLSVVASAVKSIRNVNVAAVDRPRIIIHLLNIASAYADDRLQDDLVREAFQSALALVDESINAVAVHRIIISSIGRMPKYEAVKTLLRYPFKVLKSSPDWIQAAIGALTPDDDHQYRSMGRDDRQELLREISECPTDSIAPHVSAIVDLATSALAEENGFRWAWMISDVLSVHEFFSAACVVCDNVVSSIPSTQERRPLKLYAHLVAESQRFELAVDTSDARLQQRSVVSWSTFIEQANLDEEENKNARIPFFPTFDSD